MRTNLASRTATRRRSDPAVTAWLGLIVSALAVDVWMFRKGHRLLTEVARTPTGRICRSLVELHLDGNLGRWDPFSAASKLLTPAKRPPA